LAQCRNYKGAAVMKEIKRKNVISDRALDLGVFALDNEFENREDGSHHPSFKESVRFVSPRREQRVHLKVQGTNLFSQV
jgi:hypothetical protein